MREIASRSRSPRAADSIRSHQVRALGAEAGPTQRDSWDGAVDEGQTRRSQRSGGSTFPVVDRDHKGTTRATVGILAPGQARDTDGEGALVWAGGATLGACLVIAIVFAAAVWS